MASYDRMIHDSQGRNFVPINVDLTHENDTFLTLPKGIALGWIVVSYALTIFWGANIGLRLLGCVVLLGILTFINQLILRYVVFQETYFYKLWTKERALGTPKASRFWSISSIRKTPSGDVVLYQDLKVGVILELERDTIIGRAVDNKEKHYDAWSEFYRTAWSMGLSVVQMNLMQPAGRDERFNEIADIASHAENKNVKTLLEINTAHMKHISSNTLDEYDYILIYTKNINRLDSILPDALEAASCLLDGAYVGARVLTETEIYQLPRENFNVKFFDGVDAQMSVYRGSGMRMKQPLKITSIELRGNKRITMTPKLTARLEEAVKLFNNDQIEFLDWNIIEALQGRWSQQYKAATNSELRYDDGELIVGDAEADTPIDTAGNSGDISASIGVTNSKSAKRKERKGFTLRKKKSEEPVTLAESPTETDKNPMEDEDIIFYQ